MASICANVHLTIIYIQIHYERFKKITYTQNVCFFLQLCGFPFFKGEDFRSELKEVSAIRSTLETPCLTFTATATEAVREDIFKYVLVDEEA